MVKLLLDAGAVINYETKVGWYIWEECITIAVSDFQNTWCPLTVACSKGHMNIMRLLIDRGADVNISEKVLINY